MAGTVTVAETRHTSVKQIIWDWLSAAGGNADQATTYTYDGALISVTFEPDSGGTQPTDNYDITITDANSVDVLAGNGANLSNAASVLKTTADGLGAVVASALTLNVTNAGNAKGGKVYLTLR